MITVDVHFRLTFEDEHKDRVDKSTNLICDNVNALLKQAMEFMVIDDFDPCDTSGR